ncbi:MAG: FAD-dependent oxidoreductase [Aeromicrobium sp.]
MSRPRVAVIGSGVAGLTAAWVMRASAEVTVFEASARLGGHADTHDVTLGGRPTPVDTGFIVHNKDTYPVVLRLFDELGVETRGSEMSLSIRDDASRIQWAGALGLRGVFPSARLLIHPGHLRMLREIPQFHRMAKRLLNSSPDIASDQTLAEFLAIGGFSAHFRRHFMEPVVAAVWSCDPERALEYPAVYLFTFLRHHGMLRVFGSPQWRTVVGGSRTYVERVGAAVADVRLGTKVTTVFETEDGVHVTDDSGTTTPFDAVVIATHPGQALDMLGDPTALQRSVLGAMPYSTNRAILHTDDSLLPTMRRARASWNFLRRDGSDRELTVTYDLARLQGLGADRPVLLTLGGDDLVDADCILERMQYEHPIYSPGSVAAQRQLPAINTPRIAFAGAYHGWGFHEDGARSGLAAAEYFGHSWGPALGVYATVVRHTRRAPFRRTFAHRTHTWVVDLDHLPDHGRWSFALGNFEARDHFGDPGVSIRANVEAFLQDSGISLDGGRIVLATQPRAWGYCFNPISVFWCFNSAGVLVATIAEVHNTYGDRHAYLLHADDRGDATVDKQMYVSPFHGVDGTYRVHAPVPGSQLDIGVALRTDDGALFSASLTGKPACGREPAVRAAFASLRGAALIRMHGWWLWMRRLPVHPRPVHREGVHR